MESSPGTGLMGKRLLKDWLSRNGHELPVLTGTMKIEKSTRRKKITERHRDKPEDDEATISKKDLEKDR